MRKTAGMAISYSLDLVTPVPAIEVAQKRDEVAQSLRLIDASVTAEALLNGTLAVYGTWIRVVTTKPVPWGDPLIGGRVFTPTVSVVFRLDKAGDISGQQDDMVRLASGLLSQVPGDAVLHFDYEDVWLVRQDGQLSLKERSDLWPALRLSGVSLPYGRQTHEFVFPED
ncbi:SitI3 family protein [Kitasatospora sp. GAS1066B]|uniref:SitI3 family protein n=1 Tax=Kitasatospora sp. GAS1066B TaxID=3156271 RepID=UPI00351464EA